MIGARIKAERERLGMTQPDFAAAAGAAKRTLIEWEKGSTAPTAMQLSALAVVGVDVLYVVTGQRVLSALPPDEAMLLDRYRASPRELRDAALRVLLGGEATAKNDKNIQGGGSQSAVVSGNKNSVKQSQGGIDGKPTKAKRPDRGQ